MTLTEVYTQDMWSAVEYGLVLLLHCLHFSPLLPMKSWLGLLLCCMTVTLLFVWVVCLVCRNLLGLAWFPLVGGTMHSAYITANGIWEPNP